MSKFSSQNPSNRAGFVFTAIAATALLTTSVSTHVMASGSFGGGASFGHQNAYNIGKAVFYKKLICSGCPAENFEQNSASANSLVKKLKSNKEFASDVTGKKRKAVILYLERRFSLS